MMIKSASKSLELKNTGEIDEDFLNSKRFYEFVACKSVVFRPRMSFFFIGTSVLLICSTPN